MGASQSALYAISRKYFTKPMFRWCGASLIYIFNDHPIARALPNHYILFSRVCVSHIYKNRPHHYLQLKCVCVVVDDVVAAANLVCAFITLFALRVWAWFVVLSARNKICNLGRPTSVLECTTHDVSPRIVQFIHCKCKES